MLRWWSGMVRVWSLWRQLLERTASITRLRQYVRRWLQWHRSGLKRLTEKQLTFEWYWRYVLESV
jgi:hypothetical protein